MWISIKILVLLWLINLTPPVIAYFLENNWDAPLDGGCLYSDGHPLLGGHKTVRGFLGGIITGIFAGLLFGFPPGIACLTGIFSMTGDLLSSFIKRRFKKPDGSLMPGLDQFFEGALPFAVLGPYCDLSGRQIVFLVALFGIGALAGSLFLNKVLLTPPFENYPRTIRPRSRFREWRSCQSIRHPLHFILNIERTLYYHLFMKTIFKITGLYEKGMQNALRIRQQHLEFHFRDLPDGFDNYTILFLSDLHLDGLDGLTEALQKLVAHRPVDLCLLGGDYRTEQYGSFARALLRLHHLIRSIDAADGIFAVLGNHDCLEMVAPLERHGISFLINDAVALRRNGDTIWITGVDDAHYYDAHDLEATFKNVPRNAFKILISHTPEIYHQAAHHAPQLCLCGHTHAGQIQLPLIGPLITCSRAPRYYSLGRWEYKGMQGYTSAGAGVSGIPVRFGCRGEVVLITLRKDHPQNETASQI